MEFFEGSSSGDRRDAGITFSSTAGEYRISNIEQGILNSEVLDFDI